MFVRGPGSASWAISAALFGAHVESSRTSATIYQFVRKRILQCVTQQPGWDLAQQYRCASHPQFGATRWATQFGNSDNTRAARPHPNATSAASVHFSGQLTSVTSVEGHESCVQNNPLWRSVPTHAWNPKSRALVVRWHSPSARRRLIRLGERSILSITVGDTEHPQSETVC